MTAVERNEREAERLANLYQRQLARLPEYDFCVRMRELERIVTCTRNAERRAIEKVVLRMGTAARGAAA